MVLPKLDHSPVHAVILADVLQEITARHPGVQVAMTSIHGQR